MTKEKKIKIYIKKHYKDITETNKVIALEEEDSSSPSAPSEEEAEFLPPATSKHHLIFFKFVIYIYFTPLRLKG